MSNFWIKLPRPFTALAPMEEVTDTVMRRMVGRVARPDVFFTEFTSTDGLVYGNQQDVAKRLIYTEEERPIVAQLWGTKPEHFYKSARLVAEMKFDGVDINMGCPERKVIKTGGGAGCIGEYELAKEIIVAVKEGAGGLPVSVKTRIGKNKIITEEWVGFLLEQGIDALTVHGRTAREMSKVPTHWDEIRKAVEIRNKIRKETIVIGNGDVLNWQDAQKKAEEYGVDGVMIGRGIFANPAAFDPEGRVLTREEKLRYLLEHAWLFEEIWKGKKNWAEMNKMIKMYVNGFDGASKLREKLMTASNRQELSDKICIELE
jgi:nifR3 family TIM-barrel protein